MLMSDPDQPILPGNFQKSRMILATLREKYSVEARFRRMAGERERLALKRATKTLKSLEALGLRAWVVGSLAKGGFTSTSDVDFVIDCPQEREYEAFRMVEREMGAFPFHVLPRRRMKADALPFMMEGAVDASGLSSRKAQA